jgi:chromosome segregation ATPase
MAVDIGAKVGLEGEAEYKKAITEITQQTKTLKAEMKETTTGFDKNTTAMEKAKAKAEILNKQIEVQKERIEKTKDMLQKATEAYGEADTRHCNLRNSWQRPMQS